MAQEEDKVLRDGRDLMARVLAHPEASTGAHYNDLLSLFFREFPLSELAELLRHPHKRVVMGALFIVEELGRKAEPLLEAVVPLVTSDDADIRLAAFAAISVCDSKGDGRAFRHIVRGVRDPDGRCRKKALLLMMRADDARLNGALHELEACGEDEEMQSALRMILGVSAKDSTQIRAWIEDANPLARKTGMIAAARAESTFARLLDMAAMSDDPDLRVGATAEMKFLELVRNRIRGK